MGARNYRNVCWQVFAYIWPRNGLVVAGIRRCRLDALRQGVDDAGNAIDVRDPLSDKIWNLLRAVAVNNA